MKPYITAKKIIAHNSMLRKGIIPGFICIVLLLAVTKSIVFGQTKPANQYKIKDVKELKEFFKYTTDRIPLVCGHRGGAKLGYPENAIVTFEHTLSKAAAFFEVDPRLTKDSVVVVMHDAALDRTTNGAGNLADFTWEEIRKLKLKDSQGNITKYGIHTLDEVIKWSKGKTVLILDKKNVPLEMLLNIITDNQAESHVLVSSYSPQEAKFYHQRNKDIMFEAFIKNEKQMQAYEAAGIPWENIVAYLGQPKNKELYDALHTKGVMVIIYTGPVYDKIKDTELRMKTYRDIINSGTDILLSDKVIDAARALESLKPLKSQKERFFSYNQK